MLSVVVDQVDISAVHAGLGYQHLLSVKGLVPRTTVHT